MAPNHRLTAMVTTGCGFSILILASILLAFNNANNCQYGIIIESGYRNSSFHLFRWSEKRVNLTARPESIDTCIGDLIAYQSPQDEKVIDQLLSPCISKLSSTHSLSLPNDRNQKSTSPIYFAGNGQLRLLEKSSPSQARQLVDAIFSYLQNRTQFQVHNVSIIDETSEAVYSWIAGNLHRLELVNVSQSSSNQSFTDSLLTHGVLDLSDLTNHVAWERNTVNKQNDDVIHVQLFGRNHSLISESHTCLGSDEAKLRLTILLIKNHPNNTETQPIDDPCLPINSTRSVRTDVLLADVCLNGSARTSFSVLNKPLYNFVGKGDPQKCSDLVSNELLGAGCEKNFLNCSRVTLILPNTTFVALNNYLQPISFLNLSDQHITDSAYYEQTQVICKLSAQQLLPKIPVDEANEVCFRLFYNYWLLKNVHKITGNWSNIVWDKSMQNWSRWPLGMMINSSISLPFVEQSEPFFNLYHFLFFAVCSLTLIAIGLFFFAVSFRERRVQNKEIYEPIQQQAM